MALAQVLLFNSSGLAIAEIQPDVEFVTWRLNNVSMARFSLPWSNANCTADYLAFGNRVLFRFDDGLPDWGGVLGPPRRREQGWVTVSAYSGEHLLDWRVTAQDRTFNSQSPGTIFQTLLEEESATWATGITTGSIYTSGTARTLAYHYHDLLRRCTDLARLTGEDFAILPVYASGQLSFQANWYSQRGGDLRDAVWLVDGRNVSRTVLDEQGMLTNRVVVVGAGSTWGEERPVAVATDTDSMALYGYREYAEVQSGVVNQATLDANAADILADRAWPVNRLALTVLDEEPGAFADYGVGDIVTVSLFVDSSEWYFETAARVIVRTWRPDGICELEVDEWRD